MLNFGDKVKVFARWLPDGENIIFTSEATGKGPQEHISLGMYRVGQGRQARLADG